MANRPPYRDIHSLPVEVLSPIFCILSHMDTALDLAAAISYVKALWSRSLKPPKFIWHGKPILSVCHLWREIALGCPDFWKRMPVWSVEWTEMAISQTNGKPIIIDMSLPLRSIVNADALKLALLHVSRSEALTLYNSPSLNIVPYIRDAPAPSLRSFHFQSENIAVPAEEVEVQLFQGEALPLLRKVHVESLRLTSASQLLHCPLLYLHLQDCHGPVWQSLSDMHDTLSRMPALQYLSLQNTLPSTPLFPRVRWDRPAKITMESLSNLHMEGACLQVAAVLQSMVFPQHCKIRLDVTVREHDLPECVAILKAELADHFSREPSGDEFTSLSIRDLPGASPPGPLLSFIAGRTRGAAGPGYDHLTLHIQWDVPLERRIACLTASGCPVPLIEKVTMLALPPHVLCWRRTLPNLFAEAKHIQTLMVLSPSPHSRRDGRTDTQSPPVRLPSDAWPPDAESGTPGFMFPRCETIVIKSLDFGESLHPRGTSMAEMLLNDIADEDTLRRCMVFLDPCDVAEGLAETFRNTFSPDMFVWDGQLDGYTVHNRDHAQLFQVS